TIMKQALLRFSGKKFISAAILSASLLLTSSGGFAATHSSNIEILSGEKTSVQFMGSTADALIFRVQIKNAKSENFTLSIQNEAGDVLFSRSFSDSNFLKQFKVVNGETANEKYYFTIKSKDSDLQETYVASAVTKTVANVEINKL
ncbi:MAG TPA: hypothetical protein VEV83_04210, partial [Parafilimonas sp.]|nr:hypothetical protein [Parafilimonas sp.]